MKKYASLLPAAKSTGLRILLPFVILSAIIIMVNSIVSSAYSRVNPAAINPDVKCVDGDTFEQSGIWYRLSYINAPDRGQSGYHRASKFTCDWLHYNNFTLEKTGIGYYGRTLVVVHSSDIPTTLNDLLIKNGLAKPYYLNTTDHIINLYKIK